MHTNTGVIYSLFSNFIFVLSLSLLVDSQCTLGTLVLKEIQLKAKKLIT